MVCLIFNFLVQYFIYNIKEEKMTLILPYKIFKIDHTLLKFHMPVFMNNKNRKCDRK